MQYLNKHWQQVTWLSVLLMPLSLVYYLVSIIRVFLYRSKLLASIKINSPVVVVGNISVGGTGKTPLVIWLVKLLQQNNYSPGVITRGYGRLNKHAQSYVITNESTVDDTGDEPAIIYKNCQCPVVIDEDRSRGALKLVSELKCDVIISDDGLQHYKLNRDIEIAVVDGVRKNGNGFCLPAGPLRELKSRLQSVDAVIVNNAADMPGYKNEFKMNLESNDLINVFENERSLNIESFKNSKVHAVAGIGNPDQFFDKLASLGLEVIPHSFPDHYNYNSTDITYSEFPVIMTEKDAVKLWSNKTINITDKQRYWYLPVSAKLPADLEKLILNQIKEKTLG